MSNLYIRLMTGFWSHRKTARLRAIIGDDALWVVPRLWSYAAENQPDGDLSGYTSEELAMLLGCSKHAPSMLQALKSSGFIEEDGRIHDWEQHNGYHEAYSKRAKAAADARWAKARAKKEKKQKKEDGNGNRKEDTSNASRMLVASEPQWIIAFDVELPEQFRTEDCLNAAHKWLTYKAEKRQKYTPTGLESAVKSWAKKFTQAEFPGVVEYSMSQNWDGLWREKVNGTNKNQPMLIGTNTPDESDF